MPNAAGSITLADYALMSNSPLIRKIAFSLLDNGTVLEDIPMVRKKSLVVNGSRFTSLNAVNFRAINDTPLLIKNVPVPFQEAAYIISNLIGIDKKLIDTEEQITSPWAVQVGAYMKSEAYTINDVFINNDHVAGDVNAPIGLRWRLDNASMYGIPTEMKINGGGVDVSAGSNGDGLLEYIQQALDVMGSPDGDGVVMYMSELTRRKLDRAVKKLGTTGGFNLVEDSFGRRVMYYNDARVRTIGRKADQTTQIITNTETAAGANGASTFSSIYFAKFGEDALQGWEFDSMENSFTFFADVPGSAQQQLLIDYAFGFIQSDVRAVARIYNIKTS